MITFEQFCEEQTTKRRHSWFYLSTALLSNITEEEQSLVWIEHINDPSLVRVWYPRDRWFNRPIAGEELKVLLLKAIEANDFQTINRLRGRATKQIEPMNTSAAELQVNVIKLEDFAAHGITRREKR